MGRLRACLAGLLATAALASAEPPPAAPPVAAPLRVERDRLHVGREPGEPADVAIEAPRHEPASPEAAAAVSLLVPIVLSSSGAAGSFYSTELTLVNRGAASATMEIRYASAIEGGLHTATDVLAARRQRVVPDAIEWLRSLGMPIPASGNRGGTLLFRITGLANPTDAAITARTTSPVPEGRAGLAYAAIGTGLTGPSWIAGLRQSAQDRSNVAVLNAGGPEAGDVTLRLTAYPGTAGGAPRTLPDVTLSPGGFRQFSGLLAEFGFTGGYVKVERISGAAPYWAYGVVNDQRNSDGSYVLPVPDATGRNKTRGTLPVAVESGIFTTEVVVTNVSTFRRSLTLQFVADAVTAANNLASTSVTLDGGQQLVIPDFVQYLREKNVAGIGPKGGASYAGGVFLEAAGDLEGWIVSARTSAPGGGGRYGLFYLATYAGGALEGGAWIYGLQQDEDDRANLAIVTTNEFTATNTYKIDVFDGETGQIAGTREGLVLASKKWMQVGAVLRDIAPGVRHGWAKVTRTAGTSTFLAYGVVNDGPEPATRSGDGAFLVHERDCAFTTSSTGKVFGWKGGGSSVSVTTSSGCGWTASSDAAWATLSKAGATGSDSVTVTAAQNANPAERTATLNLAGKDVTVRQLGNGPGPYDGTFAGTTSQSRPISFAIDRNELETVSMDLNVTLGQCRVSGSFTGTLTTPLAVVNGAFSGSFSVSSSGGAFSVDLSGTFSSPTRATGTFNVPLIVTGGTICLGFGGGYTWTAQR